MIYFDPVDCTWEAFIGDAFGFRFCTCTFVPGTREHRRKLLALKMLFYQFSKGEVSLIGIDPETAQIIEQPSVDLAVTAYLAFLEWDMRQ